MPLDYSKEHLTEAKRGCGPTEMLEKVGLAGRARPPTVPALRRGTAAGRHRPIAHQPSSRCSLRTSPRETSIRIRARRSWKCSSISTGQKGSPSSSSPTIRGWLVMPRGPSASRMASLKEPVRLPVKTGIIIMKTATGALRRNIMRTLLTTLGIVIGVGAVITMMEIGNGATLAIQRTLTSIGANTLVVIPGAQTAGGINFGMGSMTTLSPNDADAISRECPAVANVAPIVRARTQIIYGNKNWVPTYIYGTTSSFLNVRDWTEMEEGEAFTDHDVRNASKVCLVGRTIKRELFGGQSPVGKEIRVRNIAFKVVGVLGPKGANMMGQDQDDILLAPWTTIKYRVVATSLSGGNQSTTNTTEVNSLAMTYAYTKKSFNILFL
jgi:hypothetical protein